MKARIYWIVFICLLNTARVFAQDTSARSQHTILLSFGGLTGGEITINQHLNDSLSFRSDVINLVSRSHVTAFNLTLKCKGQVLGYFENKNGNKLTREMQEAIGQLHPGCMLIFDGVQALSSHRSPQNINKFTYDPVLSGRFSLSLTLK